MIKRKGSGFGIVAGLLLAAGGSGAHAQPVDGNRSGNGNSNIAAPDLRPIDPMRYGAREDVLRFADELAQRHGLDNAWLRAALVRARYNPAVARLIMPPAANGTARNWTAYRSRFVEPIRIRAGLAFWRTHQHWLDLAEERYGVPAEIVVAIIGVESLFGQQMGNFRVIDALATLAFDFPTGRSDRAPFFREELENFLLLCRQTGTEPLEVLGSYAGAIGMPQFLPSSIARYAVDFDGDGRLDLRSSAADVIGSVANYLAAFGWQRGQPTRFEVSPPSEAADLALLLAPDIVPTFTTQEFAQRGARLERAAEGHDGKLALVELKNGDGPPTHVAGTANFYVITRYNWSSYYAMAVIDLGAAIARERQRTLR